MCAAQLKAGQLFVAPVARVHVHVHGRDADFEMTSSKIDQIYMYMQISEIYTHTCDMM